MIQQIIFDIKENHKSITYNYPAIFIKLKFKDRQFFQSFTDQDNKSLYQIEYQKLELEFTDNYKKDFNLNFVNNQTRKKIHSIICALLTILFLRNLNYTEFQPYQLAQLIQYLINYFIRKEKTQIDYFDLKNHFYNNPITHLPQLPSNHKEIPNDIKIRLPITLPIKKNKRYLINRSKS